MFKTYGRASQRALFCVRLFIYLFIPKFKCSRCRSTALIFFPIELQYSSRIWPWSNSTSESTFPFQTSQEKCCCEARQWKLTRSSRLSSKAAPPPSSKDSKDTKLKTGTVKLNKTHVSICSVITISYNSAYFISAVQAGINTSCSCGSFFFADMFRSFSREL